MTTKQFELYVGENYGVQRNNIVIIDSIKSIGDAENLVELLNNIYEKVEQLEFDKTNLHRAMSRQQVRHKQFRDKVFNTIDKKIERGEQGIEGGKRIGAHVGTMQFHIELLKRLREELQE